MRPGDASNFPHEKRYIVNIKQLVFNHSNWPKKPSCEQTRQALFQPSAHLLGADVIPCSKYRDMLI